MSEHDNNQDELDELSPFLRKMRKRPSESFSTPPRYFEQMEEAAWKRVQSELQSAETPKTSSIWERLRGLLFRPSYALGALGMVAMIVVTSVLLQRGTGNTATTDFLALANEISDEELYEYVDENEADFDAETLIEQLQDADADYIPGVAETLLPIDTSAPTPIPQKNDISYNNTNNDPKTTTQTSEQLLEGISADDLMDFLEEEGLLEDLLEDE